jgi:hypothetical protein
MYKYNKIKTKEASKEGRKEQCMQQANMRCIKEAYVQEESCAWFQEVIHVLLPKM